MRYCKLCVLPSTRPGTHFDAEGVCQPCRNSMKKQADIDWTGRKAAFEKVVAHAKANSKGGYDCLIPVSGGKDSTWQVIRCLEYGMKPLAVTWKTPARTELGQQNLDNLVKLGVDHIDYQVNPKVESVFMLKSLKKYGSTAVPMHMAMFNIPLKIAVRFQIPLVVWGENSAFEYGTSGGSEDKGHQLTDQWLKEHGNTFGTTANDWVASDLSAKDLTPYFGPSPTDLAANAVSAIFLGYYFHWDPEVSLKVALQSGFKARAEGPKTGFWNYADIDDDFISIHHYIKWYKFGSTRLFDNLSVEIRNGRITRKDAIQKIREYGDQKPVEDIEKLCAFLEIKKPEFYSILETFRNHDVWTKEGGAWKIKDFILPDWKWL